MKNKNKAFDLIFKQKDLLIILKIIYFKYIVKYFNDYFN